MEVLIKGKYTQIFKIRLMLLLLAFFAMGVNSQEKLMAPSHKYPIIPTPQELEYREGELVFSAFNVPGNAFFEDGLCPEKVLGDVGSRSGFKRMDVIILRDNSVFGR